MFFLIKIIVYSSDDNSRKSSCIAGKKYITYHGFQRVFRRSTIIAGISFTKAIHELIVILPAVGAHNILVVVPGQSVPSRIIGHSHYGKLVYFIKFVVIAFQLTRGYGASSNSCFSESSFFEFLL